MKVESLRKFLKRNKVKAKFHKFREPTASVEDAARQLKVDPRRIVKSLVFKNEDGNPLLAIVSGVKRVDENKLSKAHGAKIRMAKAREVESFTGYKIGEVPPVGHGLRTFVDREIMDFETAIAGGGSTHMLIELSPKDIFRVTGAELAEIC